MSLRSFLAGIEPEAIPFPFSRVYSALAGTSVFRDFYDAVAGDVGRYLSAGRVLDVGSGPGKLPLLIASANPRLYVVGVDLSADMVRIASAAASKRHLGNVAFRQGSAAELPFPDRGFDLVISTLSFHHWKSPDLALDEIYRVLREKGQAWIYDMPGQFDPGQFDRLKYRYGFLRAWALRLHGFTEPFYTEKQVAGLAAESRFKKHELKKEGIAFRLILHK